MATLFDTKAKYLEVDFSQMQVSKNHSQYLLDEVVLNNKST